VEEEEEPRKNNEEEWTYSPFYAFVVVMKLLERTVRTAGTVRLEQLLDNRRSAWYMDGWYELRTDSTIATR
jgi:hypothetical protein